MADNKKKAVAKKAPAKKKGANGYVKSAPIAVGTVFEDNRKAKWKVGPAIGSGGFGDIYSCCSGDSKSKSVDNYEYVVKIEPHENGPLFVEMHFYLRNGKLEDVEAYKKSHKLTSLGMPHYISSGTVEINGNKVRFLIMPRFGKDLWSLFLANNRRIPESTVLRLAIQLLDVLEYIHSRTYVHADIKGANILLGFGKDEKQAYLVDFGLASHYTTKDYKPDPKKMHNGTIEYTSRDAHNGVPTMRGDLEILAYNLAHWLGGKLPWESCLDKPKQVQELKDAFMKNVEVSAKKCLSNLPSSVLRLFKVVANMNYNDTPDYVKLRKYFEVDMKALGYSNTGNLLFTSKETTAKGTSAKSTPKAGKTTPNRKRSVSPDEDDDSDFVESKRVKKNKKPIDTTPVKPSPIKKPASKRVEPSKGEVNNLKNQPGKAKKVFEFKVELDASFDADVIVNINRKGKKGTPKKDNEENSEITNSDSPDISTPKARGAKVTVRSNTRIGSGRKNPRDK